MNRELAFALQTQSQLSGSLGRTRASKIELQSGDLLGVPEDRSSKRLKGSGVHDLQLNCEADGFLENLKTNFFVDQTQEREVSGGRCSGISVYRRTRRFGNAGPEFEQKVSLTKELETVVEDKIKCNLETLICDDENRGALAEDSIKKESRDSSENPNVNERGSEGVPMAVDETNVARSDETNQVRNAASNGTRSGVVSEAPRRFTRSALNSPPVVALAECSSGSKLLDAGGVELLSKVDTNGTSGVMALGTPTKKLELKMSKKIALGRIPRSLKELFGTGLLEGYSVFYKSGNKEFAQRGIIKDIGILCFCSSCQGSRVVSPCQFEMHACNSRRRAAHYICLQNGRSLLQVLKACSNSCRDRLEETIQNAIGSLPEKESIICQNCKGPFLATFGEQAKPLCMLCLDSNNSEPTATDSTDMSVRSMEPALSLKRSMRNAEGCILSQDESQARKKEDRSSQPDLVPESFGHGPERILFERKCREQIIRRSSRLESLSKTSASASTHDLLKSNSQGKIGMRSSQADKLQKFSKTVSMNLSPEKQSKWKITKRSSQAATLRKFSKSASPHISADKKNKWKITKKDLRSHKLVFEEGGLPDGTELAYYSRGKKLLEGYKRGLGIFCRCCSSEVSPSVFEAHAGWASRRKPYGYIYTSNGVSLHEFAISLLKGRKCHPKENDDLCIICADGGNLLLCDGCPRAFHIECASLLSIPRGKWFCNYCENMFQSQKYVEHNANAVAAGRVSGVDLIQQITKRCIRIVRNPETEVIACVLCRGYDFSSSGFGPRTVIVCDQCEKEYHVGCLKKHKMADLKELPEGKWFCCTVCVRIYSALQNLLNRGEEKIPDSLLNVIKKKHEDKISDVASNMDVRWRLLSGKITSPQARLLLSKAVAIFHDCFDPIVDLSTGRDIIPSMVYGRNIRGLDFGGMYCAVLTVNSSVVSAGIFRVFGHEIAELPLVATSNGNQGKGYFQILFSCIMRLLAFLNVKSLVLPAADEAMSIWTDKFGFERILPEQLRNYRRICWQMLSFKGTSMLQKMVPQCRIISQDADPCKDSN